MTTIDLLRHGEAAPGLCLGRDGDPPLTATGWAQMRKAVGGKPPWSMIVSSPLSRCAEFARELAGDAGLPLRLEPRFRELGFGLWEGRAWSELYAQSGETLLAFQQCPGRNPAPEGEDYPLFEERVLQAWEALLGEAEGGHCLLVTHAGVIRALLRQVLGLPLDRLFAIHVPHAGCTRLEQFEAGPPRLLAHGPQFVMD